MVLFENVTNGQHVDVLLSNTIYTGTVKFRGSLVTQSGDWVGLSMDEPVGSHNGLYKGRQYFHCPDGHGLFVRANRIRFRSTNWSLFNNYRPVTQSCDDELFNTRDSAELDNQLGLQDHPCITHEYNELARQSFPDNFAKYSEPKFYNKKHLINKIKPAVTMLHERGNKETKLVTNSLKRPKSSPQFSPLSKSYEQENITFHTADHKVFPRCICGNHNRYNGRLKCVCQTCRVKYRFPDKVDDSRLSLSDAYDLYGYDFITSPTIPKTHMPHECQAKQARLGWDGFHYTRQISVPWARDSIKLAQWNDISA